MSFWMGALVALIATAVIVCWSAAMLAADGEDE